jgi:3-mercaptopyruvate sulfurtransferase SseA
MKWQFVCIAAALAVAVLVGCAGQDTAQEPKVMRMSAATLADRLDGDALTVIDVRQPNDWTGSDRKVKGAVRENPKQDVAEWAKKYEKTKPLVLYCA